MKIVAIPHIRRLAFITLLITSIGSCSTISSGADSTRSSASASATAISSPASNATAHASHVGSATSTDTTEGDIVPTASLSPPTFQEPSNSTSSVKQMDFEDWKMMLKNWLAAHTSGAEQGFLEHFGYQLDPPWGLLYLTQREKFRNSSTNEPISAREVQLEKTIYSFNNNSAGNGVTIFVVGSGVKTSHDDFKYFNQTNSPSRAENCIPGFDGKATTRSGTEYAAIAAGVKSGIAKNAKVCSVKVFDDYPGNNSGIFTDGLQKIGEVAIPGKSVVLLAEGVYTGDNDKDFMQDQARIRTTINSLVDKGLTVITGVTAHKSHNASEALPADSAKIIAVGAFDKDYRRIGGFGNRDDIDLWVPGEDIPAPDFAGDDTAMTLLKESGGAAAAYVAGIAAVLMSRKNTKDTSPQGILKLMKELSLNQTILPPLGGTSSIYDNTICLTAYLNLNATALDI